MTRGTTASRRNLSGFGRNILFLTIALILIWQALQGYFIHVIGIPGVLQATISPPDENTQRQTIIGGDNNSQCISGSGTKSQSIENGSGNSQFNESRPCKQ
jgi:hypothetical protein